MDRYTVKTVKGKSFLWDWKLDKPMSEEISSDDLPRYLDEAAKLNRAEQA